MAGLYGVVSEQQQMRWSGLQHSCNLPNILIFQKSYLEYSELPA